MTASARSKIAFATSETSARVGRGLRIMESSIWVALFHPETQVLYVLGREAVYREVGVREVQALVGGDRPGLEDHADYVAVLDALDPKPDEAVVYEEPVAGLHVFGEPVVGGGEAARVAHEGARRDDDPVSPPRLRAAL